MRDARKAGPVPRWTGLTPVNSLAVVGVTLGQARRGAKPHRHLLAKGKVLLPRCSAWRTMPASSQLSVGLGQRHDRRGALKRPMPRGRWKVFDITGRRYGRAVAVKHVGKNRVNLALWKCRCDCGTVFVAVGQDLRSGHTKSCGCLRRENTAALGRRKRKNPQAISLWAVVKSSADVLDAHGGDETCSS